MSSQLDGMKKLVDQLRQENSISRMKVSDAVESMVKYMNDNQTGDGLVTGIPQSENPYRDQKSCLIL